ncbi:large ribosomal subunit protein mL40-like [Dysidea avara]|uniref:large ribosomal subunit protein mL40-like n=1 Tax=Dysidea avara TaxID=196820 RepID=UPI00331ADD63
MACMFPRLRPAVHSTTLLVPVRTVKKGPKSKSKQLMMQKAKLRDREKEMQKRRIKEAEAQKEMQFVAMKIGVIGEPLDPELLNPARKRNPSVVSKEEEVRRTLLLKQWSRGLISQHKQQLQQLQGMMRCRDKAMRELKKVSQTLYEQALEPEPTMLTFSAKGPTETPPMGNYIPPEEAVADT